MKILLSYSKRHYDPATPENKQPFVGSSASVLAKTLYEVLTSFGELTYIDHSEYDSVRGYSYDLFVGIESHFADIVKQCKIQKSILFAVNSHPKYRNSAIIKYLIRNRLSPRLISGSDLVNKSSIENAIKHSDAIILLGNDFVFNTYVNNGVDPNKIRLIDYQPLINSHDLKPISNTRTFVYVASEIGLRKGFDIIYDLFSNPIISKQSFKLNVVGSPTNQLYEKKIKKLQKLLGTKMVYHGWLKSTTKNYKEVLSSSDFSIFPTIEEGQAGSLMDCVALGVIPITTVQSGINFSPLGTFELKINSDKNIELLLRSILLSNIKTQILRKKTHEYYSIFHTTMKSRITSIIKDFVDNKYYPTLSIILSIFNKEKTIVGLLKLLVNSIRYFPEIELIIIFDGCTDNSEAIVKEFLKKSAPLKIKYKRTPNVFEVKSNNLGLEIAKGKYCVVIQDDNYIYDDKFLYECVNFLERSEMIAVLGGLAGVNYYPRATRGLSGNGQIVMNDKEVYWRQDERTDYKYRSEIFEVDACMRGPLFIRKSFLIKHGYLDEKYAPLYQDDIDLCFRAKSKKFYVFAVLLKVVNQSLTMSNYDSGKWRYFDSVFNRNLDLFYSRWSPSKTKNYLRLQRSPLKTSMHLLLRFKIVKIKSKITELKNSSICTLYSYYRLVYQLFIRTSNVQKRNY